MCRKICVVKERVETKNNILNFQLIHYIVALNFSINPELYDNVGLLYPIEDKSRDILVDNVDYIVVSLNLVERPSCLTLNISFFIYFLVLWYIHKHSSNLKRMS